MTDEGSGNEAEPEQHEDADPQRRGPRQQIGSKEPKGHDTRDGENDQDLHWPPSFPVGAGVGGPGGAAPVAGAAVAGAPPEGADAAAPLL